MHFVSYDAWHMAQQGMYRKIRIRLKNNCAGLQYVGNKMLSGNNPAVSHSTENVYALATNTVTEVTRPITDRLRETWDEMLDAR